jgi:protoheme IX farnesyltransferase
MDTAMTPAGDRHPGENHLGREAFALSGKNRTPDQVRHEAGDGLCRQRNNTVKNFLLVTKPGIVIGNLIATAGGFLLASKGCIDSGLFQATLLGVALMVACGCVFNNCIDKDLDRKMVRTRNRVLPRGLMSPGVASVYASLLGMAGTALLSSATNRLCVAIVLAGLVIYVGLYSLGLKRRSVYAALVGSLAGAAPPLAGYCAVSHRFDLEALILLAVFSLWQIPHAHAIAVYRRDDFAAAAIPALPLTRGLPAAKRHILVCIAGFMAAALMLTIGGYTGYRFFAVAAVLNLSWLTLAWRGDHATDEQRWAKRLFVFSILSITVLSVMMAVDFTVPAAPGLLLTAAP